MTVVTIVVPSKVVVITASGVAVELAWPLAGGEAAALSFVSVISVIVMREELRPLNDPADGLALLAGHNGGTVM